MSLRPSNFESFQLKYLETFYGGKQETFCNGTVAQNIDNISMKRRSFGLGGENEDRFLHIGINIKFIQLIVVRIILIYYFVNNI